MTASSSKRRYSIWRDRGFSALIGLLMALLVYFNAQHFAEAGIIKFRYWLVRLTMPTAVPDKYPVVRVKDQKELADAIEKLAGSARVIGVLFDLSNADLTPQLKQALFKQGGPNGAVVLCAEPGSPIDKDLVKARVPVGSSELRPDSYDMVADLPGNSSFAATTAVYYNRGAHSGWGELGPQLPFASRFWMDFFRDPQIQYIELSALDGLKPALKDKVVLIAPAQSHRVYLTPLGTRETDTALQVRAISTILNAKPTADYSDLMALLAVPLGALVGFMTPSLKPLARINWLLLAVLALFLIGQILLFFQIMIPFMLPATILFASYLACSVIFLEVEETDRGRDLALALQNRAEDERQRIAKDIHDETLPELARIRRTIASADLAGDNEKVEGALSQLQLTMGELRRTVDNLSPTVLQNFGLATSIESLVERLQKSSAIKTNFISKPSPLADQVDSLTKLFLYRIVQEALNNVEKHSQASNVTVKIEQDGGCLLMTVADDGVGFSPASASGNSHGLANISQRAQLIGAQVNWATSAEYGRGLQLQIKFRAGKP